jgi:tRNA 2-thiouridine synthesizing protein A
MPRAVNDWGGDMHYDKELDARGLACPMPIVKTRKALNELTTGQVLKVMATDSGSVADMKAFPNRPATNPVLRAGGQHLSFLPEAALSFTGAAAHGMPWRTDYWGRRADALR